MNLKELKKMVSQEYRRYLTEQPDMDMPMEPGIEVGPNDINAMGGGEDSEATLRQIYDMLKNYFEGGTGAAAPAAPAGDMDMGMDMDMGAGDEEGDTEEEEEEEEDEVAEEKEDKKEKKEDKKELKERFKKLANIIKG